MEPPFEKLLAHLIADEVRFIVVGGLAVTLNGYVRLTEDVDLLVDDATPNLERLISSLTRFGEGFGGGLAPKDFGPEPGAIRVIEESEDCQVDLFTLISGFTYKTLEAEADTAFLRGKPFRFATKLQLISIKSGSVREKDQLDVLALKRLLEDPKAFD